MRYRLVILAAAAGLAFAAFTGCGKFGGDTKSEKGKAGYAIGMDIGKNLERFKPEIDTDSMLLGIRDQLKGKAKLTDEEAKAAMQGLMQRVQAAQGAQRSGDGEKNKAEGMAFLVQNKANPKVKATASGLQYEVLKQGSGPKPKLTSKVKVHYHGTLINGTVFDSSVQRGQPAEFPVNGVIRGWQEVLPMMPVGSKWKVTIPSELAYGQAGAGGQIGPNAVLVFEIELLAIVK